MSSDVERLKRLERLMVRLDAEGDDAADDVRDCVDTMWHRLSSEEQAIFGRRPVPRNSVAPKRPLRDDFFVHVRFRVWELLRALKYRRDKGSLDEADVLDVLSNFKMRPMPDEVLPLMVFQHPDRECERECYYVSGVLAGTDQIFRAHMVKVPGGEVVEVPVWKLCDEWDWDALRTARAMHQQLKKTRERGADTPKERGE